MTSLVVGTRAWVWTVTSVSASGPGLVLAPRSGKEYKEPFLSHSGLQIQKLNISYSDSIVPLILLLGKASSIESNDSQDG